MDFSDGPKLYAVTRPPIFRPNGAFQEWRKDVAYWVSTMKDAHDNKTDEKLKTQLELFGRILYSQGLTSCQRFLVDKEIRTGNLSLSSSFDPVCTVLAIVYLVAVDPPTAHVTRLLNSFKMSCSVVGLALSL